MPRPDEAPEAKKKPTIVERVLHFFGFGKKKGIGDSDEDGKGGKGKKGGDNPSAEKTPAKRPAPRTRTRIAKGRSNAGGNPAARTERRRGASNPPTRNARLYVGNLSYEAQESDLEDLFKGFGNVRSVEIIYNTHTYKSKGYAFVEMYQLKDARRAAEVLHGQPFMGRELMVSAASERQEKTEGEEAGKAPAETPAEAPAEGTETPAQEAEKPAQEAETPAEAPAPAPEAEGDDKPGAPEA